MSQVVTYSLIKGAVAGAIAGVGFALIFDEKGTLVPTIMGSYSVPVAVGVSVGVAQAATDLVFELAVDPSNKKSWKAMLGGFFEPVACAAVSVGVAKFAGGLNLPMAQMGKIALLGAASSIGSDYAFRNFIASRLV